MNATTTAGKQGADEPGEALIVVVTTTATRDEALALARALVERRLVACAQIEAIESVYGWDGAVQQSPECRLSLKTCARRYAAVEAALRERHPYQLPAIHAVPVIAAEPRYAAWVREETRASAAGSGETPPSAAPGS